MSEQQGGTQHGGRASCELDRAPRRPERWAGSRLDRTHLFRGLSRVRAEMESLYFLISEKNFIYKNIGLFINLLDVRFLLSVGI